MTFTERPLRSTLFRTHQAIILWNWLWCFRLNSGASDSVVLTWLYPTYSIAPSLLKMLLANQYCPLDAAATNPLPALSIKCNFSKAVWLKTIFYTKCRRLGLHTLYISTCLLYAMNISTVWITESICESARTDLHVCAKYMRVCIKYFLLLSMNLQ